MNTNKQYISQLMTALTLVITSLIGNSCSTDPNDATVGGQIGQRNTDTQDKCDSKYTVLGGATQTKFDTSTDEIWEWLSGKHSATLTWDDNKSTELAITIGRYGDDHQTCVSNISENEPVDEVLTELTAQEPIDAGTCGSALYESFSADSNPQCREQIILKDVMITITTEDGALDEELYVGYLDFNNANTGTIDFHLSPDVKGSLNAKNRFDFDIVNSLHFKLSLTPTGTSGRIIATNVLSNEGIDIVSNKTVQTTEEAAAMDLALANGEEWPKENSADTNDASPENDQDRDGEGPNGTGREIAIWQ